MSLVEVDALTGEVVNVMSKDEALAITARIKGYAAALPLLLAEAHAGRAHAPLGYGTWGEYVHAEFGLDRSRSYELIHHALVLRELAEAAGEDVSAIADTVPESHSRELHRLPSGERADAYEEAKAEAPAGKPTAANVRSIVERRSESTTTTTTPVSNGDTEADPEPTAGSTGATERPPSAAMVIANSRAAISAAFKSLATVTKYDAAEAVGWLQTPENVEARRSDVAALQEWLEAHADALSTRLKAVK